MHHCSLIHDTSHDIDEEGDESTGMCQLGLLEYNKPNCGAYMRPKTPLGPTCCLATLTAGHAYGVLNSKKYVHSSGLARNAKLAFGAVGSSSHNRLMMVFFFLSLGAAASALTSSTSCVRPAAGPGCVFLMLSA